jgi:hypothetical protein
MIKEEVFMVELEEAIEEKKKKKKKKEAMFKRELFRL